MSSEAPITKYVEFEAKPERVAEFVKATAKNAGLSSLEPGVVRYDFLHDVENAARFALYEVYESQAALDAHRKSSHFLEWKACVQPLLERPRVVRDLRAVTL
jgi:autoinducer 2-degrading protein